MKTLLVDGPNILARSAFAAKSSRAEMSVDGISTSALQIFIQSIAKYVRQVQPDAMAVYWDRGHDARDRIDPTYKSKRVKHVEPEEEAQTPFRQAQEFLTWSGICHCGWKGYEADDLIAMACYANSHDAEPRFGTVTILSGDKDLLQLLDGVTNQIRPGGGNEFWDVDRVAEEIGVLPKNMPLYMALTGDTVDGVVGVPGIGPKKAIKALQDAGWEWETLLEALGPEKAAQAVVGRRLVDLRDRSFAAWGDAYAEHPPVLRFAPTGPDDMLWAPLQGFLEKWRLSGVSSRINDGSLWYQGEQDPGPDTALAAFEGFSG